MSINKLDSKTINLISAGEVIEGPSDILKELIENAIDSGADSIYIKVKSSGVDSIEVKDNGSGITKEDLKICLERHTTSKLTKIEDLYSIESFGFRGEALASIDAVSKVTIITSTNNNGEGYILKNKEISEQTTTKGTNIKVEDLFYNLPVRKKFLKSKAFEFSKLYNNFLAFAIQNPQIKFHFNSERKNVVFTKTSKINRLIQIFGKGIDRALSIDLENKFFSVKGIVADPRFNFPFPSFLFINNRYVYDSKIYRVIKESYKDYLMIQQNPFFILFLYINPKTIDVNIHPKKKFIRLQNEILFLSEFKKELTSNNQNNNIQLIFL